MSSHLMRPAVLAALALAALVGCNPNKLCEEYEQRRKACLGEHKRFEALPPTPEQERDEIFDETPYSRCLEGDEKTRAALQKHLAAADCHGFWLSVYGRLPTRTEEYLASLQGKPILIEVFKDRIEVRGGKVIELEDGRVGDRAKTYGVDQVLSLTVGAPLMMYKDGFRNAEIKAGKKLGRPPVALVVGKDIPQDTIDAVRKVAEDKGYAVLEPFVRD